MLSTSPLLLVEQKSFESFSQDMAKRNESEYEIAAFEQEEPMCIGTLDQKTPLLLNEGATETTQSQSKPPTAKVNPLAQSHPTKSSLYKIQVMSAHASMHSCKDETTQNFKPQINDDDIDDDVSTEQGNILSYFTK